MFSGVHILFELVEFYVIILKYLSKYLESNSLIRFESFVDDKNIFLFLKT
jgi:hypothetical protein